MKEFVGDLKQLLPDKEPSMPASILASGNTISLVVLRHYRFHKKLNIELYQAETTRNGKIKNPLTFINPLDLAMQTGDIEQAKFFSAIVRFQNNPTAVQSPADLDALRVVLNNPLQLPFFYHDPEFSENIVAGSLVPVHMGSKVNDLEIRVDKTEGFYELRLQVVIDGRPCAWQDLQVKYDYFFHRQDAFHLINGFHFLQVVRFFKQYNGVLRIQESTFNTVQREILEPLADRIPVIYSHIPVIAAGEAWPESTGQPLDRRIYLSELGNYVMIDPVMKYGEVEIPVRTKRQIFLPDPDGKIVAMSRDYRAEDNFIALLLKQHPDFTEQLDNDLRYFYLHKDRFLNEDWFFKAFEGWQDDGITVFGFNNIKGNKLNPHAAKINVVVSSGLNWFNTNINVRFGNKRASLVQLQRAVRNKNKFVHLDDGTLGILPEEWIEKLAAYFNAGEIVDNSLLTAKVNFQVIRQLYEAHMLQAGVMEEIDSYTTKVQNISALQEVAVPGALNGTLREYQKEGLKWLNFLDDHNFGGCLADDMGLGKSIQVIAFILLQRKKVQQNTNLLVVPTTLIFNWQNEVQKFAPSIRLFTLYDADRPKDCSSFNDYELILTSYGTLLSDIHFLQHYTFNYIFLDESQNIKNVESQRYQAVRLLKSRNKIAITGTPVENNTFDLYAQLSFACPGLLGGKQYFRSLFSIPIDKFKDSRRALELRQKTAPFILRRTKQQVAAELPEKTEMICYCPMGEEQRKVYDACEKELRDYLEGIPNEEMGQHSMHVLRGLTRLRQICNSPRLLKDEKLQGDGSSKLDTLLEHIETKAGQHKILVFSQFVSMLVLIQKELAARGIGFEYLAGHTRNRESVVRHFQENDQVRVFLISLKAGGTGLNLTEADYVYIVDPWWNPAVENQAIDRSYRIGQTRHVVAVRLITPGTIEEKIMKLQDSKKELSNDLVKTDSSILQAITRTELLFLVSGQEPLHHSS